MSMIKCEACSAEFSKLAAKCPKCGHPSSHAASIGKVALALLCFFFGALGVHRFATGKKGTGFAMLAITLAITVGSIVYMITQMVGAVQTGLRAGAKLTETQALEIGSSFFSAALYGQLALLALLAVTIWVIVDLVMILMGKFRDSKDRPVV